VNSPTPRFERPTHACLAPAILKGYPLCKRLASGEITHLFKSVLCYLALPLCVGNPEGNTYLRSYQFGFM
jgi:hypothetical protein